MSTTGRRQFSAMLAAPMFWVTVVFLALLGGLLHLREDGEATELSELCAWGLLAIYPLYVLELLFWAVLGSPHWKQHVLYCCVPPLRLGARDHEDGTRIWLPGRGWCDVTADLYGRLEKVFSVPMVVIVLTMLPLMVFEYLWAETIAARPALQLATNSATATIWFAFALEFVVMISLVDKKVAYCKEHWIDLAVILLPLAAFLRVARLSRLIRLKTLSKTARVYRMRGSLMRLYRALLLFEVLERVLRRTPEQRLARLQALLAEKEAEIADLKALVAKTEAQIAAAHRTGIDSSHDDDSVIEAA